MLRGGTGSEPSAVAFRGAINLLICFDAQPRMGVRQRKREKEVEWGGGNVGCLPFDSTGRGSWQ